MGEKKDWRELNRALGYEISTLILNNALSKRKIQENIPYDYMDDDRNDTQIDRILEDGFDEKIYRTAQSREKPKYYLNSELFCERELTEINRRAITRMHFPADKRGPPVPLREIPDQFFEKYDRREVFFGSEQVLFVENLEPNDLSIYYLDQSQTSLNFGKESGFVPESHMDDVKSESRFTGPGVKPWTWD